MHPFVKPVIILFVFIHGYVLAHTATPYAPTVDGEIEDKLESIMEQNKVIANSILAMADDLSKLKEEVKSGHSDISGGSQYAMLVPKTLEVSLKHSLRPGTGIGYDGEDAIYFWGFNTSNTIWKYTISTEVAMSITSSSMIYGSGILVGNKNLFHFGGDNTGSVSNFKINATTVWTKVSSIPNINYGTTSVWDGGEYIYVTGGYSTEWTTMNSIWRFSIPTLKVDILGHLPVPKKYMTAVWDNSTGNMYVFGGQNNNLYFDEILKVEPQFGKVTTLNVKLPVPISKACAIWTGTAAYIIGGSTRSIFGSQMVIFTPSTNEIDNVSIINFPSGLHEHQCVLVEKLHRIYIFGGYNNERKWIDRIMYIDI